MHARTSAALKSIGIDTPLGVQTQAIPALLSGQDAVIQAPTGSGKTLAFGIPILESTAQTGNRGVRAVILGPTRELAVQTATVLKSLNPSLRVATLIGGVGIGGQARVLRSGAEVVVGCPGRILDLCSRGDLRLNAVEMLILDEADEMLDQGFAPDVERIIKLMPSARRQTILASATMPEWVRTMVSRHLVNPVRIKVEQLEEDSTLEHGLVHAPKDQRFELLHGLLRQHGGTAIVFHRTKHGAKKLSRALILHGHKSAELQGNLSQNARDRAIADFRAQRTKVLVATNVAARGLDVPHVGLIINYELPESAEWLTHRVGRTARNGANGRALTFIGDEDADKWRKLRKGGAPDLPWLDGTALLESGQALEQSPPVAVAEIASPAKRVSSNQLRNAARRAKNFSKPNRNQTTNGAFAAPKAKGNTMQNGSVKRLVSDRGFGFIEGEDGTEYFFHRSAVTSDYALLNDGDKVTFETETGPKGARAKTVTAA